MSARDARLARIRGLQGVRAGFVSRVLGFVIDLLVLGMIGFLIVFFIALVEWAVTPSAFSIERPSGVSLAIGTVLLWSVYFAYFWAVTGRTLGEQLFGLRVVREDGSRLGGWRALLRSVLSVVFPIGILWILVSAHNAAVQDLICGTAVIYDWSYHPPT